MKSILAVLGFVALAQACGISGYVNYRVPRRQDEIISVLIRGLERLEYRGYDSAGLAIDTPSNSIQIFRQVGKVAILKDHIASQPCCCAPSLFQTHAGIAHTRWATHGQPEIRNSHPQPSDPSNKFVVVHNGIFTNYKDIRVYLEKKGHSFHSDTDTECAAKLALHLHTTQKGDGKQVGFAQLVKAVVKQLEGAYALIVKSEEYPNELVAFRRSSPLLIGIRTKKRLQTRELNVEAEYDDPAPTGVPESRLGRARSRAFLVDSHIPEPIEFFVASDASAIIEHTRDIVVLEDGDIAHIADGELRIHRLTSDKGLSSIREIQNINLELERIMKGKFDHFMQKEIFEQPESVVNTMRGRINFEHGVVNLRGIEANLKTLRSSRRMLVVACGTSYHSALATRLLLEELTGIPIVTELASDFLDRQPPVFRDDVCVFVSQSGETADSLLALEYCKSKGAQCMGVTNTVGSSIARRTDFGIHINAGPEIGVASTKAYTSQFVALVMMGLQIGEDRASMQERRREVIAGLQALAGNIQRVLDQSGRIEELAAKLVAHDHLLVMGRGYQYSTCVEGALKIKEVTYIHCEGIAAGELKHGPLALVDEKMPVVLIMTRDRFYSKVQSALQQMVARRSNPVLICGEDDPDVPAGFDVVRVPETVDCLQGVVNTVVFQLLSYHLAVKRGVNVDFPRNLAKSVTVE